MGRLGTEAFMGGGHGCLRRLWVIRLGSTTQDVAVLKMGMSLLEWLWSLPECPREGRE